MTSIELLMVMAILGVVLGVGVGTFADMNLGARTAQGLVQNTIRSARNWAIANQAPARIRINDELSELSAEGSHIIGTWHFEKKPVRGAFGRCVVLRPQTYMNRSGKAVQAAKAFYRVPDAQIVVVHDELDFPFGRVAIKKGGGHGGNNGVRDIIAVTGSRDFGRVRVGVGRPPKGPMDVAAWLLSDFSAEDRADLPDVVDRAREAATAVLSLGITKAMNAFMMLQTPPSCTTVLNPGK